MPCVCAPSPMAVTIEYYGRGRNTFDVDIEQNTREKLAYSILQCTLRVENIVSPSAYDSHTYTKRDVKHAGLAAMYALIMPL